MRLNPLRWPLKWQLGGLFVVVALVAGAVAGVVVANSGSGNPAPGAVAVVPGVTTFLCQQNNGDILLQWRDSDGHLSGSYEDAKLAGQVPGEHVQNKSGDLTGSVDGSAVTLHIDVPQPLFGTLSGDHLILNMPQADGSFVPLVCGQDSLAAWNSAIAALDGRAQQDNDQANQTAAQTRHENDISQAQQALANDVKTLQHDTNSLSGGSPIGSDIQQIQSDYAKEQSDWKTQQQKGSCSDGSMSADAAVVSADASTVDTDLSRLQYDIQSLQSSFGDIALVKKDLAAVQNDLSILQGLGASPSTDPTEAINAANKAIGDTNNAISVAQGQGSSIDAQAHRLATTAQSYVNSHCG